jgi:hypothetical protein
MGNNNKLDVVALFVVTKTKEVKNVITSSLMPSFLLQT